MRRLVLLAVLGLLALPGAANTAPKPLIKENIHGAVTAEKRALDLLDAHPIPWAKVHDRILGSRNMLFAALKAVQQAATTGEIHPADASQLEHELEKAINADEKANEFVKEKQAHATLAPLRRALAAKNESLAIMSQLDQGSVKRCVVDKQFKVFAVPEGYTGSYSDVFPHGIPKDAKDLKVTFIDTATDKAPAHEVFPGQTWASQVKGFLADGRFDVRVDVSGAGFGQPDANAKTWTVVVTYDC